VNPVHNALVPPPPAVTYFGPEATSPQSCWLDIIQKKKDKKRSKYVALDFSEKTNPKKKR